MQEAEFLRELLALVYRDQVPRNNLMSIAARIELRLRSEAPAPLPDALRLTAREVELLREIRIHAKFDLSEGWQREARNLLLGLERHYAALESALAVQPKVRMLTDQELIAQFIASNEQFHHSDLAGWLYCKDGDGNQASLRGDMFAASLRQFINGETL